MAPSVKFWTKSWREAVLKLLSAAEKSQADLADAIDRPRSNVTRWLSGRVGPTFDNVRAVNKAMAELLKQPQVEDCLLALALWKRQDSPKDGPQIESENVIGSQLSFGLDTITKELDGYFVADPYLVLRAAMKRSRLPESQLGGLGLVAALMTAERLSQRLQGHVPRRALAEELLGLVEGAGFDVKTWLRTDEELKARRARDRFQLAVERVLRKHGVNIAPVPRQEIITGVLDAYNDAEELRKPSVTSEQRTKQIRKKKAIRRASQ